VQAKRVEYRQEVREIAAEDLIFLDEMGSNLSLIRRGARSKKGTRARGSQPPRKGKNVSVLGALSLEGMLVHRNIYGTTDGSSFEGFILRDLVPHLRDGVYVVMDNAKIHLGEMVRKFIESKGAKLIYLPPYSPDFSPIENCWSKLKNGLRKAGARTYEDLKEAIQKNLETVTKKDIYNWFTHGCYCT
jgi:transposase